MAVSLGAHVGQQNFEMDEMRALWRWLDANDFDWISAWDHIYEAPPAGGTLPHFEAVATLAAMAVETTNARLGCLVFYVGYRNPGLLAKAAITIDHLSGGRFELGLGGGWHEWEAAAYGYDFPSVGVRLDMLAEATELIASMIRPGEDTGDGPHRTSFEGNHYRMEEASCLPEPVLGSMPLWIGGVGEKKTLPLVARWADGWNAAYVSAAEFGRLNGLVDQLAEKAGRDPSDIERSVNLVFAVGVDDKEVAEIDRSLDTTWGPLVDRVRGGALQGKPETVADQVAAYVDAGADLVNIALRAPFSTEALEAYSSVVIPAVRNHFGS